MALNKLLRKQMTEKLAIFMENKAIMMELQEFHQLKTKVCGFSPFGRVFNKIISSATNENKRKRKLDTEKNCN